MIVSSDNTLIQKAQLFHQLWPWSTTLPSSLPHHLSIFGIYHFVAITLAALGAATTTTLIMSNATPAHADINSMLPKNNPSATSIQAGGTGSQGGGSGGLTTQTACTTDYPNPTLVTMVLQAVTRLLEVALQQQTASLQHV
jgi:hypothetical protein